jgi:hypothetical protein
LKSWKTKTNKAGAKAERTEKLAFIQLITLKWYSDEEKNEANKTSVQRITRPVIPVFKEKQTITYDS